jgi:hypothetical protein
MLEVEWALRGKLAERHDDFAQGLERVRGHVERGVRVLREPAWERRKGRGAGAGGRLER